MNNDITIALPVYKRTDYIKSALDSAVNQTIKCAILIVDNNSPHDEFEKLARSYDKVEIKYVRNEKTVDVEDNFNLCFRHAETPWVTILHDDDMLHHQYAEFCRDLINRFGENLGGIMFKTHVGEEEWSEVGTMKQLTRQVRKLKPSYFHYANTPFPGVLVKRAAAVKTGGFNKDFHPFPDIDFWYRYSRENNFYLAEQEMSYFRISSTQISSLFAESLINGTYNYRLKEIVQSKHNNFLSRLGLEFARLNNIEYYMETYTDFELPEQLPNESDLNRARSLLKYRLLRGIVRKYVNYLSYSKA
ncbi:MAG: glycosyltransferase family 2 protein [Bacteroidota bacterium]